MSNLDSIRIAVQEAATLIGKRMTRIEDDWIPIAFAGSGQMLHMLDIPPDLLGSEAGKNLLCDEILPRFIKTTKADSYALVVSGWATDYKLGDLPGHLPEEYDRSEWLFLTLADLHSVELWQAEIKRPEGASRPQLGEWEQIDADLTTGRFFDPQINALRGSEEK